jgi:hypothetical protein
MFRNQAVLARRHRACALLIGLLIGGLPLPVVVHPSTSWADAGRPEPTPTVQGPIHGGSHGRAFNRWPWPLKDYGYEQAEYFVSGTAAAFGVRAKPARYKIRIQVIRPIDPNRFSGTAIVEWSNVTAQYEIPLGWVWAHPYAMRRGHVFVLVGAQEVGVCGDKNPIPSVEVCSPTSLKGWDAKRYGALHHPGDDYSFDIYSQAVQAIRRPPRVDPVDGLAVRRVIGYGQSQSGMRMDDYLCNGADRAAKVIDAALADADTGAKMSCTPRVPTIQLWSEESAKPVARTSGRNHRIWMVPGAPHEDRWQASYEEAWTNYNNFGQEPSIPGNRAMQADAGNYGQEGLPTAASSATCLPTGNSYPRRYAVDASLRALTEWVLHKRAAPVFPSVKFATEAAPAPFTSSTNFEHDQYLNTLGGLRSPVLDVPVATYIGPTCGLFGETVPFTPVELAKLYPTHHSYVRKMRDSIQNAVRKGALLPVDAADLMRRVRVSHIGDSAPSS